jgi:1-acyl-sn-glycerol-3-phosphate acyltransferase
VIPAAKNHLIGALFSRINTGMLRRHFHGLFAAGLDRVRDLDRRLPIILYGNHSCWWDGLIEFHLSREVFDLDAYLMMEERQMRRYRFFRWIGAFSVNRDSPREAVESLRYAAGLFTVPGRLLWIYPQGVMRPNDVRPLAFSTGLVRLLEMIPRVQVMAMAHRYEFLMDQRPDAFVSFGSPRLVEQCRDGRALLPAFQQELTDLLDGLKAKIVEGRTEEFERLLRGRISTNEGWDRARLMRPQP